MRLALRSIRLGLLSPVPNFVSVLMTFGLSFGLWGALVGKIGIIASIVTAPSAAATPSVSATPTIAVSAPMPSSAPTSAVSATVLIAVNALASGGDVRRVSRHRRRLNGKIRGAGCPAVWNLRIVPSTICRRHIPRRAPHNVIAFLVAGRLIREPRNRDV